jgi:hypothetical protein
MDDITAVVDLCGLKHNSRTTGQGIREGKGEGQDKGEIDVCGVEGW